MTEIDPAKDALPDWWLWRMPSERLRLRGAAVMGPNAPMWERKRWESRTDQWEPGTFFAWIDT